MYYQSKTLTMEQVPSRSVRGHIMRAFYAAHLMMSCLDEEELDPRLYGFHEQDDNKVPVSLS